MVYSEKLKNIELPAQELPAQTEVKISLKERVKKYLSKFRKNVESAQGVETNEIEGVPAELVAVNSIADVAREISLGASSHELVGIPEQNDENLKKTGKKLGPGESILEKENPYEYMVLVRVTNNQPVIENGKLIIRTAMQETEGLVPRPTLHFTVNCRVGNNDGGNWDNVDFGYVIPMDEAVKLNGQPYAIGKEDTFWATVSGMEIPTGSKIIYNSNKDNDRNFQQLKDQCKTHFPGVEFVANQNPDHLSIENEMAEMGFGNIPDFTAQEEKLAHKLGVKIGGYGSHSGSPIQVMERTFMHGMPDYEPASYSRGNVAIHTPFGQLESLYKVRQAEGLPEEVFNTFEDLALKNLQKLTESPKALENFIKVRRDGPAGIDDGPIFKEKFYENLLKSVTESEKINFYDSIFKRPELVKMLESYLIQHSQSPEAFAVVYDFLKDSQDNAEDVRKKIIEKSVETGGYLVYVLLKYLPNVLSSEQVARAVKNIVANKENFKNTANPKQFQDFIDDIVNNKAYYAKLFGEENYSSLISI